MKTRPVGVQFVPHEQAGGRVDGHNEAKSRSS